MGHSMSHSRDLLLQKVGRVFASLCGGFSLEWWSPKHNMHHMFTNSQLYDDDIKHDYKVYLFPFLYLKWRFDSFTSAITSKNLVYLFIILDGYNYDYLKLCSINLL
jgi:fatty acid desaturase